MKRITATSGYYCGNTPAGVTFMTDTDIIQADSGAPVFVFLDGKPLLAGLANARWPSEKQRCVVNIEPLRKLMEEHGPRMLCEKAGPIAAPSANRFGRPSPTKAAHVYEELNGRIPLILDGGSSSIGIESTIVSLAGKPELLRPGKITLEELRRHIPSLEEARVGLNERPRAPGMKYRHYAPRTPLWLLRNPKDLSAVVRQAKGRVGLLCHGKCRVSADVVVSLGHKPATAGRRLFNAMRKLDKADVDVIIAEGWEEKGVGLAIMNRLKRAAARIIYG